MRLLWVVLALVVLAVAGLSGYAYLGDMSPERREMRVPVSLTGEPLPAADTAAANDPEPDADPQQPEITVEDSDVTDAAPAAGSDVLD